jgi:hypothetical protein
VTTQAAFALTSATAKFSWLAIIAPWKKDNKFIKNKAKE